jgi:hypothetical protein
MNIQSRGMTLDLFAPVCRRNAKYEKDGLTIAVLGQPREVFDQHVFGGPSTGVMAEERIAVSAEFQMRSINLPFCENAERQLFPTGRDASESGERLFLAPDCLEFHSIRSFLGEDTASGKIGAPGCLLEIQNPFGWEVRSGCFKGDEAFPKIILKHVRATLWMRGPG